MPQEPSTRDEHLRLAIQARFRTAGGELLGLRIGVLNGIAHLGGSVSSLNGYLAAADLAAGVPGIRGVVNRIEAPGAPSPSRQIQLDVKTGTESDE